MPLCNIIDCSGSNKLAAWLAGYGGWLVMEAGWLAGWLDGWMAGWGAPPPSGRVSRNNKKKKTDIFRKTMFSLVKHMVFAIFNAKK